MKAINDAVVIKTIKDKHNVAGGIELYSHNNDIRYNLGEVITASPLTTLVKGDIVYYDSVAGSQLRHEEQKYLIIKERDISIILDEDEKEQLL